MSAFIKHGIIFKYFFVYKKVEIVMITLIVIIGFLMEYKY